MQRIYPASAVSPVGISERRSRQYLPGATGDVDWYYSSEAIIFF
jgi:hypothetical protein